MVELTNEQLQFIKESEELFKTRYTEEDEEFMKIKSTVPRKPPIIDPWHNAPQRSNWSRQGQDRRNWQRHDRDRERGRDRDRDREEIRDRDYRHGGRHHSHRSYRY